MYESLTVFETLWYAAQLRLPRNMTKAQKKERVQTVIKALGLDSCSGTIIGELCSSCRLNSGCGSSWDHAWRMVCEKQRSASSDSCCLTACRWSCLPSERGHTPLPICGPSCVCPPTQAASSGRASAVASASAPVSATSCSSTPASCCWTSPPGAPSIVGCTRVAALPARSSFPRKRRCAPLAPASVAASSIRTRAYGCQSVAPMKMIMSAVRISKIMGLFSQLP